MLQYSNIRILEPETWLVSPQKLFAELHQPGRTDLPAVLPINDPTGSWWKPDPAQVAGSMLNNFSLKFYPSWKATVCHSDKQKTVSVGLSRLQNYSGDPTSAISYSSFAGYSLLFLNHPLDHFYNQLERARGKIPMNEHAFEIPPRPDRCDAYAMWSAQVGLPAYRLLREIGYSHRDLIT